MYKVVDYWSTVRVIIMSQKSDWINENHTNSTTLMARCI